MRYFENGFIYKLNQLTGKQYRLPTEAEWEFAARGRTENYTYSGSNNRDDVAWYQGNSSGTTHPVGTKAPNELGIYDMNGNVQEWCSDIETAPSSFAPGIENMFRLPAGDSCHSLSYYAGYGVIPSDIRLRTIGFRIVHP